VAAKPVKNGVHDDRDLPLDLRQVSDAEPEEYGTDENADGDVDVEAGPQLAPLGAPVQMLLTAAKRVAETDCRASRSSASCPAASKRLASTGHRAPL
jgi:hypothetical protein